MENSHPADTTKTFSLKGAKIMLLCYIIYTTLIFVSQAFLTLFAEKGPEVGFDMLLLWQLIGNLLFIGTYYYLCRFFSYTGNKKAVVCIYILMALSVVAVLFASLNLFLSCVNIPSYDAYVLSYFFSFLANICVRLQYPMSIVLGFFILTNNSSQSLAQLMKPTGIMLIVYNLTLIIVLIALQLFSDVFFANDMDKGEVVSKMVSISRIHIIFEAVSYIVFMATYITIFNLYRKYGKIYTLPDSETVK